MDDGWWMVDGSLFGRERWTGRQTDHEQRSGEIWREADEQILAGKWEMARTDLADVARIGILGVVCEHS